MKSICYLCNSENYSVKDGSVRDNKTIDILECNDCGLVYLSSQIHIEDEHYENSGMHDEEPDIDAWLKETQVDDKRRYQFLQQKIINKKVLDFGCGVGGFLALANQSASATAGVELEKVLQSSYKARNLSVFSNLNQAKSSKRVWDLITAFHVIEHLADPALVLQQLSGLLSAGGEIIIEVPSSNDALLTLYENKPFQNFTYWSQHLYLFNANTMQQLIKKAGLKLNWVKHVQRYSLTNHLYWLAKGKPGGHKHWEYMNSSELNNVYEQQLASLGLTDTIIAGVSL